MIIKWKVGNDTFETTEIFFRPDPALFFVLKQEILLLLSLLLLFFWVLHFPFLYPPPLLVFIRLHVSDRKIYLYYVIVDTHLCNETLSLICEFLF